MREAEDADDESDTLGSDQKHKRRMSEVRSDQDAPVITDKPPKTEPQDRERRRIVTVDRDLDEEFTRLVQGEADEKEWNTFCAREGKRLAQKNREWVRWLESSEDEERPTKSVSYTGSDNEVLPTGFDEPLEKPPGTPELGKTTETHPKKRAKRVKVEERIDSRPSTTEVTARRSQ